MLHDRVIRPALKRPAHIYADDLAQNSGVYPFFIIFLDDQLIPSSLLLWRFYKIACAVFQYTKLKLEYEKPKMVISKLMEVPAQVDVPASFSMIFHHRYDWKYD